MEDDGDYERRSAATLAYRLMQYLIEEGIIGEYAEMDLRFPSVDKIEAAEKAQYDQD